MNDVAVDFAEAVKRTLIDALSASHVDLVDESRKHASHFFAGEKKGSHFIVTIVSPQFEGQSPIERHKAVYAVLDEELKSGAIHALSMKTYSPAEWLRAK